MQSKRTKKTASWDKHAMLTVIPGLPCGPASPRGPCTPYKDTDTTIEVERSLEVQIWRRWRCRCFGVTLDGPPSIPSIRRRSNSHYDFRLRPQTVQAFMACVRGYRLTHPKQHLSPSCYRFCYHKPLLDWQAKPAINSRQTDFSESTIYDGVL